jgi:phosphoglucosamine mutase
LQSNANIGIAFDGDGDRVIMSDHRGNLLDGDQILYIIVKHLLNLNKMKGGVVGTLMTNLGLEEALNNFGVELVRTPVGDHYVTAELNKRKWTIGGETCGHVICSGQTTSGDGIITALQVLSVMCEQNQSLLQLNGLKKYPQELINIEVTSNIDPNQSPELQQAIKTAEKKLGKKGRVLVRRSGTQNLVRVMVEGPNATQVNACVHELAQVVEAIFK